MSGEALAYIYCGAWVAECPGKCGNVQTVSLETVAVYRCGYCQGLAPLRWPPEEMAGELMAVLNRRPNPDNRNWYPEGHDVAVRFGLPHGQSVQDLVDESAEHGVF
jgi:hypothetical protein